MTRQSRPRNSITIPAFSIASFGRFRDITDEQMEEYASEEARTFALEMDMEREENKEE